MFRLAHCYESGKLQLMKRCRFGVTTVLQVFVLTYPSSGCGVRRWTRKFPDWPPGARTANATALYH